MPTTSKYFGRYQAYTKFKGTFIQAGATGHNAETAKDALAEAWAEANDAARMYGGMALVYDNRARHGEGKSLLNNPKPLGSLAELQAAYQQATHHSEQDEILATMQRHPEHPNNK